MIIAGASISGMAASCALEAAGHQVHVYELTEGRMTDRGAGLVVDEGLISTVTGRPAAALGAMTVKARQVTVEDAFGEISHSVYPATFGSTTWSYLHRHLARSQSPTLTMGVAVVGIAERGDGVEVTLSDGSVDTADGVILADGYGSRLRSLVDPMAGSPRYEGVVLLRSVMPERDCAPELHEAIFDDRMHLHNRPSGYGLMYTTPGVDGATGLGERTANAGIYLPMDSEQLRTAFMTEAGDPRNTVAPGTWRTGVAEALTAQLDEGHWDPAIKHVLRWGCRNSTLMGSAIFTFRPNRLAHGRIALVGDSAHATSPITGAGSAAALKDALALSEALTDRGGQGVESVFDLYNNARLGAVQALVDLGRAWSADFLTAGSIPEDPPIVLASAARQA